MARKDATKKAVGVIALVFGILVIVKPSLLSILVGIYMIIIGISNLLK